MYVQFTSCVYSARMLRFLDRESAISIFFVLESFCVEIVHIPLSTAQNPQETANLVTFTEEILNGKLNFLCRDP